MAEKLYKSREEPGTIYVLDDELVEVPVNFIPVARIYHVVEVDEQQSDYKIESNHGTKFFMFSSKDALEAWKKNPNIVKTQGKDSVTNPGCLKMIGRENDIVEVLPEEYSCDGPVSET